MTVKETYLQGCFVITPKVYVDQRGFFLESFNKQIFENAVGKINFVQDNQSVSKKGVLRGLHFQTGDYAQAKLLRVIQGSVLDVCVDLRVGSKTFGKHFSIILDNVDHKQLYIPRGFAHGFLTLENNTIFNYKCDNFYSQEHEAGIVFDDEFLNIDWDFPIEDIMLSDKDKRLPTFEIIFK